MSKVTSLGSQEDRSKGKEKRIVNSSFIIRDSNGMKNPPSKPKNSPKNTKD